MALRYTDNIDYLVSAITYLSSHKYYWARSPTNMARELSLDRDHLRRVFEGFPGIFRRSVRVSDAGEHFYAVQARYAQRDGGDTSDPEQVSYIEPLPVDRLRLLTDFVLASAEAERAGRRAWITNTISVGAALIAAGSAIAVAILRTGSN